MCAQTVVLSDGTRLTGKLIEHVGAGCVIVRVDGRNVFGVKAETFDRRRQLATAATDE